MAQKFDKPISGTEVLTTKGLIPIEQLEIRDVVSYGTNSREVATEWYLAGELVKRDLHVIVLAPLKASMATGSLGG